MSSNYRSFDDLSLTLTVDGESVTEDAVLANGNYYLPASFYTGLGVEL